MLKITIHDAVGPLRLELEGRLAGVWVYELEHCWHRIKASQPDRKLSVDLTSVTFIGQAGRYFLQLMHRDGAGFIATDLMLQDVLEHFADNTE